MAPSRSVLPQRIASVEVSAPDAVERGGEFEATFRVLDADGNPVGALLPVEMRLLDATDLPASPPPVPSGDADRGAGLRRRRRRGRNPGYPPLRIQAMAFYCRPSICLLICMRRIIAKEIFYAICNMKFAKCIKIIVLPITLRRIVRLA